MFKKDKSASDNFSLSQGGVTTVNSFATVSAIAHDRLRQVQSDSDQRDAPEMTLPSFGRFWIRRNRRSHASC